MFFCFFLLVLCRIVSSCFFFSLGPNLERSFKESASNFSINGHFRLLSHFFVSLFQVDSEHLPVRTTPSICPVGYLSLPTSPQFLSSPTDTFESEQSHGSESSSRVETSTKSSTCNVFQVKVQVKFCLPIHFLVCTHNPIENIKFHSTIESCKNVLVTSLHILQRAKTQSIKQTE